MREMMMGRATLGWASAGSNMASIMFAWALIDRLIPSILKNSLSRYASKLSAFLNPYVHITVPEYTGDFSRRNEAYTAVEAYLTDNSSSQAKRLRAEIIKPKPDLSLTIDTYQEVVDLHEGAKMWWYSGKVIRTNMVSFSGQPDREERRYYRLSFHARRRRLVTETYLPRVIGEGKAIVVKNRKKKLLTNNALSPNSNQRLWSSVVFDHPATFETLAMDPARKKELMDDLSAFRNGKDYYARIGKAWKRGYLLFGPPGTGKSSLIAAMANFMDYDVYDLELTAVNDNTELRKLLFNTASRSIIVIEDIDCSLNLAGKRTAASDPKNNEEKKETKVTLSGLLNFIDGLWSACGGERIIVFTTNHVEKLDPALIRRGRMDMHVELSFCGFEGFKVLAKNYLGIESHALFERIGELMEEVSITPADVAENLMPKGAGADADVAICLQSLVDALLLIKAKADANRSTHEEEMLREETEVAENIENEDKTGEILSDENEVAESIEIEENM